MSTDVGDFRIKGAILAGTGSSTLIAGIVSDPEPFHFGFTDSIENIFFCIFSDLESDPYRNETDQEH